MWISVDEYLAERKDCDVLVIILIIEYSALLCLEEIFKRRQGLHASRVHSCFVKNCPLLYLPKVISIKLAINAISSESQRFEIDRDVDVCAVS